MKRFLLALSLAASVEAATLYTVPTVWAGNGQAVDGNTSHVSSLGTGSRMFDSFSLGSAATINQATWWGFYQQAANPAANGNPSQTQTWNIGFYADAAGTPGSALSSTSLSAGLVTTTLLGSGIFAGNSYSVYQFTADLTAFNAAAGTTYWFSPLSQTSGSDPNPYGFVVANGTGVGGIKYGQNFLNGSPNGPMTSLEGNMAFSLSGSTVGAGVPDGGATMGLLGAGLAALALVRRRFTEMLAA